jgi:glyceraldehyde 3-phosphate dehydrogenase
MNIVINGFGRIGRLVFRELIKNKNIKIVGINDLTDAHTLTHLLKYDSAHGVFDADISTSSDSTIKINNETIKIFSEKDPENLP